jgi:aerobic carbon-monoxide dehydrogenase large subunit
LSGDGAAPQTIGRRMLRLEDRPLLTGEARFVDDLELPGMQHARFVRSPLAHAAVVEIEIEAAREMPGVREVVTGADPELPPPLVAPNENPNAYPPSRPLLAGEVVRFAGEPVAVVIADSPYAAEDAAARVEVALEARPALTDPVAAADGQPLHEHHSSNVLFESPFAVGDVDEAFERAAVTIEREFRNPRLCATPIETRGTIAAPEGPGVRIWASTQGPHKLAQIVAETLGVPRALVWVTTTDVGGGFGQKAHVYPEDLLVAWLARRLDAPVKWIEDRSENLLAASHARDTAVRISAAADADGRLLALDVDVTCDQGAYGVYPHGHILEALGTPAMIPGPYRLANYRSRGRTVVTNKCPEGAYRGVGLPVAAFVHERLMDVLAGVLGIDRAEIRRRNLVSADEMPYVTVTSQRYDSGDYGRAMETALQMIGYEGFAAEQAAARQEGRLLGLGISCYVEYTGMGSSVFQGRGMTGINGFDGAFVSLGADGIVTVRTTVPGIGQGIATAYTQLTADELGLPLDRVVVHYSDTRYGELDGTGAFASRGVVSGGGAIAEATAKLRERLIEDAADRLGLAADRLEIVDGAVRAAGDPASAVAVADLAADAEPGQYEAGATYDPPSPAYPYATHACIVEVDPESGAVGLVRYVVVEDCGRLINPTIAEGQTHGAVAQGIGGATAESVIYDRDGQMLNASLMDYLVPTASEIPALELEHLQIPAPESPYGAKGIGEGGTLAPSGAIANAVSDALGVEMNELPLTPERVHAAAKGPIEALRGGGDSMDYDRAEG